MAAKTKISDAEALAIFESGEGFVESSPEQLAAFQERRAPMRAVWEAQKRLAEDEASLRRAAIAAHEAGFSWTEIGTVLGVSRHEPPRVWWRV